MQNKESRPAHVQEFIGKYEETNPISRYLVSNFYNTIETLLPKDVATVLEAGCGAGYSAETIIPMLPEHVHYEGSDIGQELVTLAKDRLPHITFSIESLYDLKRPDNSFDLTIALETLEHLENPDRALQELVRVSKRYVLISVPREPLWCLLNMARLKYLGNLGNTPGHLNHWTHHSFKKFASKQADIIKSAKPLPWNMLLLEVR